VSAEHQRLERKYQRLQPKNQSVHEAERIDGVQREGSQRAGILGNDRIVIAGIGIGDAGAARRDAVEAARE
jgi:hypothetical protein